MRVRRPLSIAVGSAAMAAAVAGSTSAVAGGAARGRDRHGGHQPGRGAYPGRPERPADHGLLRGALQDRLLRARPGPAGLQPGPAGQEGHHRQGRDDRHRRLLRIPHRAARPGRVRQAVRPAQPAVAQGDPASRPGGQVPADLQPRRLGRRDRAGRRVVARDGPGREHPPGGDADLRERGHDRLPGDRQGRDVRGQPPPRRGDQPELQRDRADLPVQEVAAATCAAPTRTRPRRA